MGTICLPYLVLPSTYLRRPVKIWIFGIIKLLNIICNVTYEIQGRENIPNEASIIASKHQSTFETFIFFLHVEKSIFIHKKQLFLIPIFGQYLKKANMISIDRAKGVRAIKKMLLKTKEKVSNGNSIIIFPEGTRKRPGDKPDYKTGIAGIYKELETKIVPVALNSGLCWSKNSFVIKSGHIIINFLDHIPSKLNKLELMKRVEKVIEEETNKII